MVLERSDEHLPFFKFKFDFQTLRIFTPFLQSTRGRSAFRTCNCSQASQDGFTVRDFVKPEGDRMRSLVVLRKLLILKKNMKMVITIIQQHSKEKGWKLNSSVAMLLIFQEEISLKLKSPSCLRV